MSKKKLVYPYEGYSSSGSDADYFESCINCNDQFNIDEPPYDGYYLCKPCRKYYNKKEMRNE